MPGTGHLLYDATTGHLLYDPATGHLLYDGVQATFPWVGNLPVRWTEGGWIPDVETTLPTTVIGYWAGLVGTHSVDGYDYKQIVSSIHYNDILGELRLTAYSFWTAYGETIPSGWYIDDVVVPGVTVQEIGGYRVPVGEYSWDRPGANLFDIPFPYPANITLYFGVLP